MNKSGQKGLPSVLLVTLWGYSNFGNRLQAVALKSLIEGCGYDVECLASDRRPWEKIVKNNLRSALGSLGMSRYRNAFLKARRAKALKHSSSELLSPVAGTARYFEIPNSFRSESYTAFVTGSDQVWHHWSKLPSELPFFYLQFAPQAKRVAYGASFGFEEIPASDLGQHREGLLGIPSISCREKSGCGLVADVTGSNPALVLDPTLCVGKEFWENIEERPSWAPNGGHVLLMCLGSSEEASIQAGLMAERLGLPVIDLRDTDFPSVWDVGIGEFLWLIHHAAYVCTDSFHCVAISVAFGTDFTAFHRKQRGMEDMWDRIATLLELVGMEDREFGGSVVTHRQMSRDASMRFESEVQRSRRWLADALTKACYSSEESE